MLALAELRAQQTARLHSLAAEVGALPCVVCSQVWTSCRTAAGDRNPVLLRSEAQCSARADDEAICSYARASASDGIRAGQMELLGDCRLKGALRVVEDLREIDARQHPRDKLPGNDIPACSALFLPIFDPSDPLSRRRGSPDPVPCGLLEVLVCRTAQMTYNHSDLINAACHAMDKFQFAVSGDATAFKDWSKQVAGGRPGSPFASARPSPRSSLSRSSSTMLLGSGSSDDMLSDGGRAIGGPPPAYAGWPRASAAAVTPMLS